MKKLFLMAGILGLTACVNSNDKVFQDKNYQLAVAELSVNSATYQYVPYDGSRNMIVLERYRIEENYQDQFIKDWYARETKFRKNDCKLQYKTEQNIPYATCDFKDQSRYAIYVLSAKKGEGFAKAYVSVDKKSEENEKALVRALDKFYP